MFFQICKLFVQAIKSTFRTFHLPHQLEIYDPVEQSQDTLKPNEEEVTGFEQKIPTVRFL